MGDRRRSWSRCSCWARSARRCSWPTALGARFLGARPHAISRMRLIAIALLAGLALVGGLPATWPIVIGFGLVCAAARRGDPARRARRHPLKTAGAAARRCGRRRRPGSLRARGFMTSWMSTSVRSARRRARRASTPAPRSRPNRQPTRREWSTSIGAAASSRGGSARRPQPERTAWRSGQQRGRWRAGDSAGRPATISPTPTAAAQDCSKKPTSLASQTSRCLEYSGSAAGPMSGPAAVRAADAATDPSSRRARHPRTARGRSACTRLVGRLRPS